jgi:hypothetical protein
VDHQESERDITRDIVCEMWLGEDDRFGQLQTSRLIQFLAVSGRHRRFRVSKFCSDGEPARLRALIESSLGLGQRRKNGEPFRLLAIRYILIASAAYRNRFRRGRHNRHEGLA